MSAPAYPTSLGLVRRLPPQTVVVSAGSPSAIKTQPAQQSHGVLLTPTMTPVFGSGDDHSESRAASPRAHRVYR